MHAQDLIRLNNEKRDQLNQENLKYYLEMLSYIRLNAKKSEQQTEEVLLELLDHLILSQQEGKHAKDIFGEDLKSYCDEVIDEIPAEKKKESVLFITFVTLNLLGTLAMVIGIIGFILSSFFHIGPDSLTFPLGSALAIILIDLFLLYILIQIVFKWLKGSSFKTKKANKWLDFFQIWLLYMIFIGTTMAVFLIMPEFGAAIKIPYWLVAGIGFILFLAAKALKRFQRMASIA
ncbi:DUF1129 family protein [Oceanobacillus massiliensis]|uniref:DUF1129 family protein n=1 Tax=Oceanobacillus massiliensis TaxID=1465765 RepID=UPI000288C59B|nr:DUF1129 family protein [Oceanobacillus massiliensis]